jgi:UDP-N-acetylglucosamine 2-epimerase (non-hydrolysing)
MTGGKPKLLFVFGTRPEFIKLLPVIIEVSINNFFELSLLNTNQHTTLGADVKKSLMSYKYNELVPYEHKNVSSQVSYFVNEISQYISSQKPDAVIVQGDTSSSFAGGLASYLSRINVFHVEAGLRTLDLENPYPEELYRTILSKISRIHFCPTPKSAINLKNEGISQRDIFLTGNTVVDSLLNNFECNSLKDLKSLVKKVSIKKQVLISIHRRENFEHLHKIIELIGNLALDNSDFAFYWLVHPNPLSHQLLKKKARNLPKNLVFVEPLSYSILLKEMLSSSVFITDSGGVQEEATVLGLPLIILRNKTERPESFYFYLNKHIKPININRKTSTYLSKYIRSTLYAERSPSNVFGDGKSASKILKVLKSFYGI